MSTGIRTLALVAATIALANAAAAPSPIQIYGAWHCGNDPCAWSTIRDMAEFDRKNHWLIDRGDGSPSVNLVVLSFVNPYRLLKLTNDAQTVAGIPVGMTPEVVRYFTTRKIRVMLSIGGLSYVEDWDKALAQNPKQLGSNAARVAQRLGVGIEIDYENDRNPNLNGLRELIDAYRSVLPYDAAGTNPAARLTIDLAPGDEYLVPLTQYATSNWLTTKHPVLDYANAMVPFKQVSASVWEENWEEHVRGSPPVAPLAPAKLTGSLFTTRRGAVLPECNDFAHSLEKVTGSLVRTVKPRGAGKTEGMLGYMFWAAGCFSAKWPCTTPPNTCEAGIGMGAKVYNIPLPMPSLRPE
jgi:hypothetical protein